MQLLSCDFIFLIYFMSKKMSIFAEELFERVEKLSKPKSFTGFYIIT